MFGGIFTGLSGMQAFSSGLRQVSNNITNLNTTGFKGTSVVFNNLYNTGSNGLAFGGGNGLSGGGVELSLSQVDFSAGELRQTGRDLDLAVDGDGFLVLEQGGDFFYTRTGSFEVDQEGYIVLAGTDLRLTYLNGEGKAEALSIESHRESAPEATSRIELSGNLSSTSDSFTLSDIPVFDELGEEDSWTVDFSRAPEDPLGQWTVSVTGQNGTEIGTQTLTFNSAVIDASASTLTFTHPESGQAVELDFSSNVTSFSSGDISTLSVSESDGHGLGQLTSLQINQAGQVEIGYSNEQTIELGSVTLALFNEPQELQQREGSLFVYDSASGRELVGAGDDRAGRVLSGRIEASNVDLSQQFGDLILVQRGFQASSQVISISNDMIQQLFGIRGQG